MKRSEAEQLLGGYATGTLTEAEQTTLFAAALDHQEVFDALAEEEALRELLADPEARARLLTALAPAASGARPFWRRPATLASAASLLLATLAGLTYLRSPEQRPPALNPAAAIPAPIPTPAPSPTSGKPAPSPTPAPQAPERKREGREMVRPTGPDQAPTLVKETAAPTALPLREEAAPAPRALTAKARLQDQAPAPPTAPGRANGVASGVIGGIAGGVPVHPSPALAAEAATGNRSSGSSSAPQWKLTRNPDGSTRVWIQASRPGPLVLLRRRATGVEVLPLQRQEEVPGGVISWTLDLRLAAGDALDLYQLNRPVADLAALPEAGPVDGFRARIHPAQ